MRPLSHDAVLAMMTHTGEIRWNDRARRPGLHFFHHGEWVIGENSERPCVYAWVAIRDGQAPEIIYVGKAGSGLQTRCVQHANGFRYSTGKGGENGRFVLSVLEEARIDVYALWPEPMRFNGEEISSHSSVEDYLLAVTSPPPCLNREARRKAQSGTRLAAQDSDVHGDDRTIDLG